MNAEFIATAALRASLLLALGLAALRWLPRENPQHRRLAALLCLAASLVLPFLSSLAPGASAALPEHWMLGAETKIEISRLAWTLVLIWSLGVMLAIVQTILRLRSLRRWIRGCEPLSLERSLSSGLPVRTSPDCAAPCVAGFLRPVLIVPQKAREWDAATWNCVLAHEWQHVRQGDLWLGWIAHTARVLYWWNPLAWKLSRHAGLECEACCDDAVLRLGVKAADYARVLLHFASVESPHTSAVLSIRGRTPSSLRLRMERLLSASAPQTSLAKTAAVACLILTGMAGCWWFAFEKPAAKEGLSEESTLRWQANPFPGDSP